MIDEAAFGDAVYTEPLPETTIEVSEAEAEATIDALISHLDHLSYTPTVGETFTEEKVGSFFQRYGDEIKIQTMSLLAAMADEGTDGVLAFELTPEMLTTWGRGSGYLRGHSDQAIEVARVTWVDEAGLTQRARLLLYFDTEVILWDGLLP